MKLPPKPIFLTLIFCTGILLSGCLSSQTVDLNKINTAAPVPYNQNKATTTEKEVDSGQWKTYESLKFNVGFKYDEFDQYSGKPHLIKETDDQIVLFVQGNDFGHTLTVYSLNGLAVNNYIKQNFMNNVDSRCRLDIKKGAESPNYKYPENYLVISINSADEQHSAESIYGIDCGRYGNMNAIAYFLYNENVADKLLWVSLGQDTSLKHYQDFLSSISIFK